MNKETADEIPNCVRQAPREIRVLCPKGHFIGHIQLYVPDFGPPHIHMHPRPNKEYVFNLHEGSHGFRMDTRPPDSYNVRLHCTNRRCRYTGSFNFTLLGLDLAEKVLSGHTEYQMTN